MGRLSPLCGSGIAGGTGACCGMTYLQGGNLPEVKCAINNMLATLQGMICDGAKSSCALKVASAVTAGLQAVMLAMDGKSVPGREGIVDDDIEACIANLGRLGSSGMREADKVILDIMLKKK